MSVMQRMFSFAIVASALVATPMLAAPPVKRPLCQVPKAQPRDAKRTEPCRSQGIPPVIDPTPMFLASGDPSPALTDLS